MKKFVLLLSILLSAVAFVNAQTMSVHLSGTVTAESTGAPVASHEVIIRGDSLNGFPFYASRHTNANGVYDCTIQNVPISPAVVFTVSTLDCNNYSIQQTFVSSNSPVVVNFVICIQPTHCEAAYTYYHDTLNVKSFHFISTSSVPAGSTIISYLWDFGDGSAPATTQDPWHTYTTAGVYAACLTIATSTGCTSVKCQEIHVVEQSGCEAKFEYQRDSSNLLRFHFFDTSSVPQGSTTTSRSWDFGDGSAHGTTSDPWHIYDVPGEYQVCLTITTSAGCTSSKCVVIHAGANPPNCENWITYTSELLSVHFEGHTHSTYETSWEWNFGDPASAANTSSQQSPQHIYTAAGTYIVTLHTVDATGCESSRSMTLYIHGFADLHGCVHAGNNLVDHGSIELIRIEANNAMTVVATQIFGDSLGSYWFSDVAAGHYYLKAELLTSSAYYGQYAPTYYTEALNWTNAVMIELGTPQNPYNFGLRHMSGSLHGNGNINGTVTQGTKVNTGGTAAADVEVLLLDGQNAVLTYTKTDSAGQFHFPGIALGNYTVWPEVTGLPTVPAHFTLNEATPDVNLPFNMNSSNVTYGISNDIPQNFSLVENISPNPPVGGNADILVTLKHDMKIGLNIYNQMGQLMQSRYTDVYKGSNLIRFSVADLPNGTYFLQLRSPEGGSVNRKFTIVK